MRSPVRSRALADPFAEEALPVTPPEQLCTPAEGSTPADLPHGEPPCLFGFDPTPGVVCVEVDKDQATLILARDEERLRETRPFRPWLLAGENGHPDVGGQRLR